MFYYFTPVFRLYKYNYNNNEIKEYLISELINREMSIPDGELLNVWETGKDGKGSEDSYQSDYMEIEWYDDEMTKIKFVNEAKNMFHIINENKIYPKTLYFKVKADTTYDNKSTNAKGY